LKFSSCGTRPIICIASLRRVWIGTPNTLTSPDVALTSELMMPIRVDLPAPFGPSNA
jgi:hypothetical protein